VAFRTTCGDGPEVVPYKSHLLPSKPVPTIECRVTARSAVFASPTIEWRA